MNIDSKSNKKYHLKSKFIPLIYTQRHELHSLKHSSLSDHRKHQADQADHSGRACVY